MLGLLHERVPRRELVPIEGALLDSDPFGIDVQLALCVCYELHYRGFAGVDAGWEWNPSLLHLRARLEQAFLSAVGDEVGDIAADGHRRKRDGGLIGGARGRTRAVVFSA